MDCNKLIVFLLLLPSLLLGQATSGSPLPISAAVVGSNASRRGVAATSSSVISLFTGCSGTMYLGADGICHTASSAITGGTCTNQVMTALSTAGAVTCTTITSAYVDSTIATVTGTQTLTNKTLTTPVIGQINDANGNAAIVTGATASAVDQLTVTNSATGTHTVAISATGSDTNISLNLNTKGTGSVQIGTSNFIVDQNGAITTGGGGNWSINQFGNASFNGVTSNGNISVDTAHMLRWPTSSPTLGIAFNAAGIAEINSGTLCSSAAANCRDIKLRHTLASGTAPTIASGFGTSPAIAGGDQSISITIGSGGVATSGTVTLGTAYTNAPNCVAGDNTSLVQTRVSATTTTLTVSSGATPWGAGDVISIICAGY